MTEANIVYIGNKPPMTYVMALISAFKFSGGENVVIKARGRAISTAVDVAEIVKNRFLKDLKAERIEIGSEDLPIEGGGTRGVSTIAITMNRIGRTPPSEPRAETPQAETPQAESKDVEIKVAPARVTDLSQIKGVGRATEEKLKKAGYKTIASIAKADTKKLSKKTGISEKVAAKLIDSAKELRE
jgi:DNA-binding protein